MIHIAIDGTAGAGKGTVSKFLAQHFNLKYLDTGLLYREVARLVESLSINFDDLSAIKGIALNMDIAGLDENILRTEQISSIASQIAVLPDVRNILTLKMQEFANCVDNSFSGVILDGRDIGIAVLPNADVKIFITADSQIRAMRRKNQLHDNKNIEFSTVLENILVRDQRDQNRIATPLQTAKDAIVLDTTYMDIQQVYAEVIKIVNSKLTVIDKKNFV